MSKQVFIILFTLCLGFFPLYAFGVDYSSVHPQYNVDTTPSNLPEDIQKVLQGKVNLLILLLQDPAIIEELIKANQKPLPSEKELYKIDQEWINSRRITPFIKSFMTNDCAKKLLAFKAQHPEFSEIFIADIHGLNACQTDKTADYYQADEKWWSNGYNHGQGQASFTTIEFDTDTQSAAAVLYAPVMDPQTHKAIGVCKGIIDTRILGCIFASHPITRSHDTRSVIRITLDHRFA